jgi:endonuclease/exonuclease/phosphatase (EEP) superfamily protein YafD
MMPPVWRRAALVVAPWLWFVVRDVTALLELVAVLLPLLVAIALAVLVALAVRKRWFAVPAASVVVFGVVAVVGPWLPHGTGHPADGSATTIAVANVLAGNAEPQAVVQDIVRRDADVLVVPEATIEIHELLAARYAFAIRADRRNAAIGVYARVPIAAPTFVPGLLDQTRQQRVEVHAPGGDFVLWAVHLPKPWLVGTGGYQMRPPSHARKLDAFLDAFAAEQDLPLVVAGDTNLTDRGRAYRRVTERFDDALRGIWGGPTARKWYLRPLLLRVDHVFIPEDWCADQAHRFPLGGSDHRGVAVRVGPCSADEPANRGIPR